MRVAIDATPLTVSTGGITRYTKELSLALATTFPEDEFILMSDQAFSMPGPCAANLKRAGVPRGRMERRWWAWGIDRELGRMEADVFHGPEFSVPYLSRFPSVLSLHDLSPWLDPGWHHAAGRVRKRTPLLIGFRLATMIITDTEAVRRQAIERFRIHPGRIVSVPLAANSPGYAPNCRKARASACDAAPYFLYVGTLEPRKNIPRLIEAWRAVRKLHSVDLVLAGRRRADFPELKEQPGLRVLGEVADEDLPELYTGALAFVYPSFYEGFGLPILEAMRCGALVIASKDPAIAEVAGGAAIHVDAGDARALTQTMMAAITQPEWAGRMREKSRRRASEFSWTRTARLTREVYDEARRRFGT